VNPYDVLIRGGEVVNAPGGPQGRLDVGIAGGEIVALEPELAPEAADTVIDASGALVLPGLVDAHVHVSGRFGRSIGLRMLVRAGVTTALDLAGDPGSLADGLRHAGCGVTAGVVVPVVPGGTVDGVDPGDDEIDALLETSLRGGAIGLKVLGGHYPITPGALARVIAACSRRGAYCAVHAGSTETGSDIRGLEELMDLAGEHSVHVAHVNSYCRGQIEHPVDEAARAVKALREAPGTVRSESYMAVNNGAHAACEDGRPTSDVVKTCLRLGGFEATEAGLREAISAGWARIHDETAEGVVILDPERGLAHFTARGSHVGVGFPVNAPSAALAIALARDAGGFVVDALASDGGSFPRNTILEQGLALVEAGVLSRQELVLKASLVPARWLGLRGKGRIELGADADVVVARHLTAAAVVAGGRLALQPDGAVEPRAGRMLCTPAGTAALSAAGVEHTSLEEGW
jgi:cytosine/adenosine deaminase-related metal-dependent hydrolase